MWATMFAMDRPTIMLSAKHRFPFLPCPLTAVGNSKYRCDLSAAHSPAKSATPASNRRQFQLSGPQEAELGTYVRLALRPQFDAVFRNTG
jgi:hypothetical protein